MLSALPFSSSQLVPWAATKGKPITDVFEDVELLERRGWVSVGPTLFGWLFRHENHGIHTFSCAVRRENGITDSAAAQREAATVQYNTNTDGHDV